MNRRIVWADACDHPAGTPPDPQLWEPRETDRWQPAGELQTYTAEPANAAYDGRGHLVITAIRAAGGGYTSARLRARHPGFLFGRFEATIRVPDGTGVWPAWWLLGPDHREGRPHCGEIDILEAPASKSTAGQAHQGVHCALRNSGADVAVGVPPSHGDWGADFHTYAVDWRPGRVDFYIDNTHTGTVTRADVEQRQGEWPFDDRLQSPILNLAVGGWAGTPDPGWTTMSMLVKRLVVAQ